MGLVRLGRVEEESPLALLNDERSVKVLVHSAFSPLPVAAYDGLRQPHDQRDWA